MVAATRGRIRPAGGVVVVALAVVTGSLRHGCCYWLGRGREALKRIQRYEKKILASALHVLLLAEVAT